MDNTCFDYPLTGADPWALTYDVSHHYMPGVELYRQGDKATCVYWIREGWVKMRWCADNGKENVILRGRNWLLGAGDVVLGGDYQRSVETISACEICLIKTEHFKTQIEADPRIMRQVLTMSCYLNRFSEEHFAGLLCLPARDALLRFIRNLVSGNSIKQQGEAVRIRPVCRMEDLGALLGISREHVAKLLQAIESRGLLKRRNGWWYVDTAQLLGFDGRSGQDSRNRKIVC